MSEKISSYNVYCNRCCITRDLEKFFVEEHKDKGYTKISITIEILYEASAKVSSMFLS
jgi:hypothetical protein